MQFLNDHAFSTPTWMLREDILRRIEPAGAIDRVRSLQTRHLNNILDMGRLARLAESEAFGGVKAYSLVEMMDDLRKGIWAEVYQRQATDPYRRSLQRAWVEGMQRLLTQEQRPLPARFRRFSMRTNVDVSTSDIRPVVKAQLNTLKSDINANIKRVSDDMTRYHLEDIRDRIDAALGAED